MEHVYDSTCYFVVASIRPTWSHLSAMQQQLRTTFASVMLLIIFSIIISTAAIAEGDNTSSDRILSSKTSNSTNSSNHFSNVDYVANANAPVVIRRSKRYLDFLRLSRMFVGITENELDYVNLLFFFHISLQFRINMKENVLKSVTFWSRGYGYRANFNIENKRRIKRSMVYDTITDLINQYVFGAAYAHKCTT